MKKKIKYSNEAFGEMRMVRDFHPSPDEIVFKEDNVKVTLSLSKASIEFFKDQAEKHHTQYQKMIRRLLDMYVSKQRYA